MKTCIHMLGLLLVLVTTNSGLCAERESKLTRVLSGRSEPIRLQTIAQLENDPRSRRESLDELIDVVDLYLEELEKTELIRQSTVRLIYLIASTQSDDAEGCLVELLSSQHAGVVMVTADALGLNKFYNSIEYLKRQIDRPEYANSYGFRFNLVRALARMEHPDAVEFLTEIEKSFDGQLRFEIESLLEQVTVGHFLGDEERYKGWLADRTKSNSSEPDFLPAESKDSKDGSKKVVFQTASAPESLKRIKFAKPQQYYGIDIRAKRLMFIIDHSGSMKNYWNGYTRLQRAKNELVQAIRELPHDAEFGIVFYHTNVNEWRDELQVASEENKREAIQFVGRLGYGKNTNTYGALRKSLHFDESLEAVFLLTDGRPTCGDIVATPAIVSDILHRNRFRHLQFNTIGIAVGGPTEAFLKTLAVESNGEFRHAD